jgi:hypothetical protein
MARPGPAAPAHHVASPHGTRFVGVRVVSIDARQTVIEVRGSGLQLQGSFGLSAPHRFVLDFHGAEVERSATLTVASPLVRRVRVGQFSLAPDLVVRVVFDLERPLRPRISDHPGGLRVTFEEP